MKHPPRLLLLLSFAIALFLLADAFLLPTKQAPLPVTRSQCELSGMSAGANGSLQELYECSLFDGEKRLLTISNCTIRFQDYPGLQFSAESTALLSKHKALLVQQSGVDARLLLHLFNNPLVLFSLMILGLLLCLWPGTINYDHNNVLQKALSRAGAVFSVGILVWYLLV